WRPAASATSSRSIARARPSTSCTSSRGSTTGNLYLGIHAMAMLFAGILHHLFRTRTIAVAGWLFFAGVLVFSGTLFLMALGGPRWLGAVTPIGGTLFLIGWGTLVVGILKSRA
ncbi:MAG: DUF423 domain-containing protein, partial [Gammaproteobacteria bacterium]